MNESENRALYALHRLLVQARWMAGELKVSEELYNFLDELELVPRLIAHGKLRELEAHLTELASEFAGGAAGTDALGHFPGPDKW